MRLSKALAPVVMVAVLAGPARAASDLAVAIREVVLDPQGGVRMVVSVSGEAAKRSLTDSDFVVTEQGKPVGQFVVQPLLDAKVQAVGVVLALDVSGSTKGRPLQDAKAAAKEFLLQLPEAVQVALVSFGANAELRVDFTSDRQSLAVALDDLQAGGNTALNDAVTLAASVLARFQGQHNMVLFSDGKDTSSRSTLEQAVDAAAQVGAPVTTVSLLTTETDHAALTRLAEATGGRSLPVVRSSELRETFRQVAQEIASQYVISYTGSGGGQELDVAVTANVDGATAGDSVALLNPRIPEPLPAVPPTQEPPGFLSSRTSLWISFGLLFIGLVLLIAVLLTGRGSKGLRTLRGLPSMRKRGSHSESTLIKTPMGRRALDIIEHAPKPRGYEERVQMLLEQAGWPLRAGEFLLIRIVAGAMGMALGAVFLGSWFLGFLLLFAGLFLPSLIVRFKIQRRSVVFYQQLPDTLQICAGSLEAGYGLMQVIDTVVKESSPPTSTEFTRVLTETRLGMSLDDSLGHMVQRIGGEDFRWVTMAIGIQRQIGGNLAALLTSVAATIRERQQLRRQVRVLSAEGRISAIILILLPFFLSAFIALTNSAYLGTLLIYPIGKLMIVGGLVSMVVGVIWMRKIIRIDI